MPPRFHFFPMRPFLSFVVSSFLMCAANGAVIQIDFGSSATNQPGVSWNNLSGVAAGSKIEDLETTDGDLTGFGIEVTGAFRGVNSAGTLASTLFPASATQDSFYGNTVASTSFPGTFPNGQLTLSGLSAFETYDLLFYASRVGTSNNRNTTYTVEGGNGAHVVSLDANNVDDSVSVAGLTADENGRIVIDVGPGEGNNTTERFYYIGVLQITSSPVPEPGVVVLGGLVLLPVCLRRRRF